ncbi:MAG: branched-chain amino acid aminotransferase [Myxococcales bacterium]|nr:branched-chain amino acid aminotransferase [Myxococcales bacterium]MCB9575959.1 branched-chain amino acid aminotransferase [Polyangiaceae bacterium]
MQIEVRRTNAPRPRPESELGFGRIFADHMVRMDYAPERGWHSPRVEPYAPIQLDPTAAVLHYAQAIFEGLKAFRGKDGQVRMFRPDRHAARFAKSAERVCIPPVPEDVFVETCRKLVEVDRDWVPTADGAALYIRPLAFATEPFLGVRPSLSYTYLVMTSPVGAYYAEGFAPVRIVVERREVRAAHGGLGSCKTPANYAASLHAAQAAKKKGFSQVLWTDAAEHRYVEEVGTMNLFVHLGDEIVTPALDGAILAGVTRDSVIQLLKAKGLPVVERRLALDEIRAAHDKGQLHEIFGTGTAAVVSPVSALGVDDEVWTIGKGDVGPLARSLFDQIVAIQRGQAEDRFGWMFPVG